MTPIESLALEAAKALLNEQWPCTVDKEDCVELERELADLLAPFLRRAVEIKPARPDIEENQRVWKSYVWHGEKCFFVSTIWRDFSGNFGTTRGMETLVWECDWKNCQTGALIHQAAGVHDHQEICRSIIATGEMPKEA